MQSDLHGDLLICAVPVGFSGSLIFSSGTSTWIAWCHMGVAAICQSCGGPSHELARVRRAYVTPEAWDTEGKVEVLEEIELWCFPCRSHYPHEELDAGP